MVSVSSELGGEGVKPHSSQLAIATSINPSVLWMRVEFMA